MKFKHNGGRKPHSACGKPTAICRLLHGAYILGGIQQELDLNSLDLTTLHDDYFQGHCTEITHFLMKP